MQGEQDVVITPFYLKEPTFFKQLHTKLLHSQDFL